jgi:predicted DNA-binding transcriptional regulator AlpA
VYVLRHVEGPDHEWLSLREVAACLRVSESTLRRLVQAGKFPPGVRHGGVGERVWSWLTVVSFGHLSNLLPSEWSTPPQRQKKSSPRPSKQTGE